VNINNYADYNFADYFDYSDLETPEELAIDGERDALQFNTFTGNLLRQGGVVYFECVAVRLDANGEPVMVSLNSKGEPIIF